MQANREVEIDGVTYEKINAIEQSECTGCVASNRNRDNLCSVLSNDCFNSIWIKKEHQRQPQETQAQPEVTSAEEPKYTVEEVLEAIEQCSGRFCWDDMEQINDWLTRRNNPEYKLYLELKAKFGE